jgi:hypothetical protein
MTDESTALARGTAQASLPSTSEYALMLEMAKTLVQTGFLPKQVDTPQKAFAIIQKGRELGIPAMYAFSNINVIEGKPTAGAELMLALIYRDHGDDAIHIPEADATHCTIVYRRRNWGQPETFTFDMEDAKRAGLTGKDNWRKFPGAMLRARAISAVARLAFPDSIGGMYTPEELGAEVIIDPQGNEMVNAPASFSPQPMSTPDAAARTQVAAPQADNASVSVPTNGGARLADSGTTENVRASLRRAAEILAGARGTGESIEQTICTMAKLTLGLSIKHSDELSLDEMTVIGKAIKTQIEAAQTGATRPPVVEEISV